MTLSSLRPRWLSQKNAAVLAYERTTTARAARKRTFWLNALAALLVFGSPLLVVWAIWRATA